MPSESVRSRIFLVVQDREDAQPDGTGLSFSCSGRCATGTGKMPWLPWPGRLVDKGPGHGKGAGTARLLGGLLTNTKRCCWRARAQAGNVSVFATKKRRNAGRAREAAGAPHRGADGRARTLPAAMRGPAATCRVQCVLPAAVCAADMPGRGSRCATTKTAAAAAATTTTKTAAAAASSSRHKQYVRMIICRTQPMMQNRAYDSEDETVLIMTTMYSL